MSHIDFTPRAEMLKLQRVMLSTDVIEDAPTDGALARGLVVGLALGLTFWTIVAILMLNR